MDQFATALWCDEVREEAGNKLAFLGIYTGDLVVGELPARLPRLNACVTIVSNFEQPITSLDVLVVRDDGVELGKAKIENIKPPLKDGTDYQDRPRIFLLVSIEQPVLPVDCKYLKVEIHANTGFLETNKLKVRLNPELIAASRGTLYTAQKAQQTG